MNKVLFSKKDLLSLFGLSIFLGIFKALLCLPMHAKLDLENAFLRARDGNMDFGDGEYNAEILATSLMLLVLFPLLSKIFSGDFDLAKSYVFFRMKSNTKWYYYKVFQSFIYCLHVSVWSNLVILITAVAMGYKASDVLNILIYLMFGVFANCVVLFMFVFLNNVCSIVLKSHISAIISFSVLIIEIGLLSFAKSKQVQYHLLVNYYISWHIRGDVSAVKSLPSFAYYAIIITIIFIEFEIGKHLVKKTDMI